MISRTAATPYSRPTTALTVMTMLLLCISCNCHHKSWVDHPGFQVPNDSLYPLKNQVIVWKNPKSTEEAFQKWLDDLKKQRPSVQALAVCSHCDSDMLLLYDTSLLPYLQSQTIGGSGGSTGGGPSGSSGPTLFCGNYQLTTHDSGFARIDTLRKSFPTAMNFTWPKPKTNGALIVAVFDTGLDSAGASAIASVPNTCFDLPPGMSSSHGWNFSYNNSNTFDDMPDKHGTKVTKMIMDQVQLYGGPDVSILPVKIFDSTGKGTLFGMLCSIAYASGAGAKIINASFGFYHCEQPDTANTVKIENLMDAFLDKYLNSTGMLMIAAAGNDDPHEDSIYHQLTGGAAYRDLDSNRFYPACFARTHNNIIAVTTVSQQTQQPSPLENTSKTTVDAGANCNTIASGIYVFYDPITPPRSTGGGYIVYTVTGSSFATPIVTGRIAALYYTLTSKTDKQLIIPAMNTTTSGRTVLLKDPALANAVVNGEVAP